MSVSEESVTSLLEAMRNGDDSALDRLFTRVYDELHALAHRRRRDWIGGDYTLNTTALVHEVYLKLSDREPPDWASRAHFMAVAARAMRHILINYAERRRAKKRGGDVKKYRSSSIEKAGRSRFRCRMIGPTS